MEKSTFPLSIKRILHPTDFTLDSDIAFAHALGIAINAGATLDLLHVADNKKEFNKSKFPSIRQTLSRWGCYHSLSQDSINSGFKVNKIIEEQSDPVKAVLQFLDKHSTDLIVLASHKTDQPIKWFNKSVSEPIARKSHVMTLFIPHGNQGFVSYNKGKITLRNVLVPVDVEPQPQLAIDAASLFGKILNIGEANFELIHVGDDGRLPSLRFPENNGWKWNLNIREGKIVQEIIAFGHENNTELAVLTTRGHHGFLDALRGSITERVLHGVNCPLLSIPAN